MCMYYFLAFPITYMVLPALLSLCSPVVDARVTDSDAHEMLLDELEEFEAGVRARGQGP